MASGIGNIYVDNQLISFNQKAQKLWIESKDIELGEKKHKYIDTIQAELKDASPPSARIKIGWRDRLEDDIKWTDWFKISDGDNINWTRITGRFFRVRIEDDGAGSIWKLSALEFFGRVVGGRL